MQDDLSDEYSQEMQQRMGGVLTYRHEDGMNYDNILDDLIVGSCPQTPQDIDRYEFNLPLKIPSALQST